MIPNTHIEAMLLAGAAGDCIGFPAEGQVAPAGIPDGEWRVSDDTLLTLATCEGILRAGGVAPESIAKGGRVRRIPMTDRLRKSLKAARHLKGDWVFCDASGKMWSRGEADTALRRARNRAGLRKFGWHTLRHTFCSHLAMKGAPVRTIQELAGHASITTTMRYMHLTESAAESAIKMLEATQPGLPVGYKRSPLEKA